MTTSTTTISHTPVPLARSDLRLMLKLVRLLYQLKHNPVYFERLTDHLPAVARFDPGHDSVMMCYDFHLTPEGPRLIEINTNAGGGLLALKAALPEELRAKIEIPNRLQARLLKSFADEYAAFTAGQRNKPSRIAIIDENPPDQFLYDEMKAFATLFERWGVPTEILDPGALECSVDGVFHSGQRCELIYNRHCDFYLEEGTLSGLRQAYLAHSVCLTPNPHSYGLLGDKRRMVMLRDAEVLSSSGFSVKEQKLCRDLIPETVLMADRDAEEVWTSRKNWVFKPVIGFGSKGVLVGEKITRKRFAELDPDKTLIQKNVAPSMTSVSGHGPMKTDYRVFVYRNQALGVTARLYRGQVTNMQTPGGGFAPIVME